MRRTGRLSLAIAVLALGAGGLGPASVVAYSVPRPCTVPNVVGMLKAPARESIRKAGCKVGTVTTETSTLPKGQVISQDPSPGTAGPTVNLIVSSGPARGCLVPDVIGRSFASAEKSITKARCQVGSVTTQTSPVRAGRVISQSPAPGSAGPTVDLVVSSGPAPVVRCRVPNLVGKRLAVAKIRLLRAHCAVGRITKRKSRRHRGRVVAQSLRPGSLEPGGMKVNLTVSKGRRHRRHHGSRRT